MSAATAVPSGGRLTHAHPGSGPAMKRVVTRAVHATPVWTSVNTASNGCWISAATGRPALRYTQSASSVTVSRPASFGRKSHAPIAESASTWSPETMVVVVYAACSKCRPNTLGAAPGSTPTAIDSTAPAPIAAYMPHGTGVFTAAPSRAGPKNA